MLETYIYNSISHTIKFFIYLKKLRTPTIPRKCFLGYGTSSCITYFKLREHLMLIK